MYRPGRSGARRCRWPRRRGVNGAGIHTGDRAERLLGVLLVVGPCSAVADKICSARRARPAGSARAFLEARVVRTCPTSLCGTAEGGPMHPSNGAQPGLAVLVVRGPGDRAGGQDLRVPGRGAQQAPRGLLGRPGEETGLARKCGTGYSAPHTPVTLNSRL